MNHDRLRIDLADLAEEVTPVDLRDRALRTSRRLGIQRAIATSAAAFVMVGAATGTAFALIPRGDAPAPIPADSPSVIVTPSPADPSPTAATSAEPTVLAGTRYYLGMTDGEARVHAVRGATDTVLARVPYSDNDPCTRNSITISPDGRRLAWVVATDRDRGLGTLVTAGIDGSNKRNLAADINCFGPTALVWQGGDLLMVGRQPTRESVQYDVRTGKVVLGPLDPILRRWSADGRYLAAESTDGQPFVDGPSVHRNYNYTPPADDAAKWGGWEARSVSMDGRYVAVGWIGTDVSREDGSFAVVDTTTGKEVDLPGGAGIRSIMFTADNKVLVRRATGISVLDSTFKPLGTVTEPAALGDLTLLAYAA
ncbi:WD40 repeat domain-containing protein [Micromonospora sp. NPDC047707]|uniref:WD40 repeat domain-containing protein n=1 Tax=Micromonospora sp. NPDC047707 TaxID=3154498 RepID=UPI003451A300